MTTIHDPKLDLARDIVKAALRHGNFKLRSGATSNIYFDKYRIFADPDLLAGCALTYASDLLQDCDDTVLAGLEMGGIPLVTAIAQIHGHATAFVRKKRKDYGTCQIVEGAAVQDRPVTIVEDVITSGGAVADAIRVLCEEGTRSIDVTCLINRRKKEPGYDVLEVGGVAYPIRALFTLEDLQPFMEAP